MAIPDYQTSMLPFLQCLADGREHALAEIRESLATHFSLADEELEELLPSGNQTVFENRIGWARTYLSTTRFGCPKWARPKPRQHYEGGVGSREARHTPRPRD